MKVEIPLGDVVDKISILRIKLLKLKSSEALSNVERELNSLLSSWRSEGLQEVESLMQYQELSAVNSALWNIEDDLRFLERQSSFGDEFIEKARKVYQLNDRRSVLKRQINVNLGSALIEEKSHI